MPRLRRDIRHDPSTPTNKPRTHLLRSDSETDSRRPGQFVYSVLEFGFGSCKICSVLSLLLTPPTGGDTRQRRLPLPVAVGGATSKKRTKASKLLERWFGPKCHAILVTERWARCTGSQPAGDLKPSTRR